MNQLKFLQEILIVIVLYKKSIGQSNAFETLEGALPEFMPSVSIFIYDNSPDSDFINSPHIIYKHDPENNGVSRAYNMASAEATRLNKKWMLLLDQDAEVTAALLSAYELSVSSNPAIPLFVPLLKDKRGIVSPFRFHKGNGHRLGKIRPGIHTLKNLVVINNGMLISTDAFCKTQGYDERFPLDLSDVVFLERFRIQYPDFYLLDVCTNHNLSANNQNVEEALHRFGIFCQAMRTYKDFHKKKIRLNIVVILRGVKLFFSYKEFEFLTIGFGIKKAK